MKFEKRKNDLEKILENEPSASGQREAPGNARTDPADKRPEGYWTADPEKVKRQIALDIQKDQEWLESLKQKNPVYALREQRPGGRQP